MTAWLRSVKGDYEKEEDLLLKALAIRVKNQKVHVGGPYEGEGEAYGGGKREGRGGDMAGDV